MIKWLFAILGLLMMVFALFLMIDNSTRVYTPTFEIPVGWGQLTQIDVPMTVSVAGCDYFLITNKNGSILEGKKNEQVPVGWGCPYRYSVESQKIYPGLYTSYDGSGTMARILEAPSDAKITTQYENAALRAVLGILSGIFGLALVVMGIT